MYPLFRQVTATNYYLLESHYDSRDETVFHSKKDQLLLLEISIIRNCSSFGCLKHARS